MAGGVGGAGTEGANSLSRYAAHAGAGCVSSVAGGGNCGQGAASAVFGKFTTNQIVGVGGDSPSAMIARGVATAVAGGVGSTIAGGKFENGATTAAFGYLFNEMLSDRNGKTFKSRGRYYEGDRSLGGYDPGACLCSSEPPSLKEQYDGFKLVATPFGLTRILTTFVDAGLAVGEFSAGNRIGGYQGAGSLAAGTGVELMLRPLGSGISGAAGHLTGIVYDQIPQKKN
jgi:hypothetical protein